jgi:hypothetical protein
LPDQGTDAASAGILRRFALHVVPGGLVRMRQYGLLANRGRGERLEQCRRLLLPATPAPQPAGTITPPSGRDDRWLMLFMLVVTTAPAESLTNLQQLPSPTSPACTICGSPALLTLWQAPRPSARQLPPLAQWTGRCESEPPLREDSS